MGFSMAARLTVPGFEVVNRAGRAGWQGHGQAGRQAGRQAGTVNGISGTALVKLRRASGCLFHTKKQLTQQLMSIDIDCQKGSAYKHGPFCLTKFNWDPPRHVKCSLTSHLTWEVYVNFGVCDFVVHCISNFILLDHPTLHL